MYICGNKSIVAVQPKVVSIPLGCLTATNLILQRNKFVTSMQQVLEML
jgi:hypothetical protein